MSWMGNHQYKVTFSPMHLNAFPTIKWRMSIHDNETTSKIYPDLNPMVPQELKTYRLKKLTEIQPYLLDEIEVRERIAKKM